MIETICGVDVRKAWLDGCIDTVAPAGFANDASGGQCGNGSTEHGVGLVVMEASGGVEQDAFLTLWQAGMPCALANPRHVRKFAEAMGIGKDRPHRCRDDCPLCRGPKAFPNPAQ